MRDQETMESIDKAKEEWERMTLRPVLNKWPERYEQFITTSGEAVERLYTPLDIADRGGGVFGQFMRIIKVFLGET